MVNRNKIGRINLKFITAISLLVLISVIGFLYASIGPIVLSSPANSTYISDSTPDFIFTATSNSSTFFNCTLIMFNGSTGAWDIFGSNDTKNSGGVKTGVSTTITANGSGSATLVQGEYLWEINCSDGEGDTNDIKVSNLSAMRNITVDTIIPLWIFFGTRSSNTTVETNTSTYIATGRIHINISTNDSNVANVSINLYKNATTTRTFNQTSVNNTVLSETQKDASVNFTGLADGTWYVNATVCDKASSCNHSVLRTYILDATSPNVTTINRPAKFINATFNLTSNFTTFIINITVDDANLNYTLINIYAFNASAGDVLNTSSMSATSKNIFINLSVPINNSFTVANYTINVTTYDKAGNTNTTTKMIMVDSLQPVKVTATGTLTQTSITMAINISDGTGGVVSACTVNKTANGELMTVSGTTTSQTATSTGLTCNTGYSYNITCADGAGNVNSSLVTFTTSACSVASSSSGGGSSSATPSELATGFTKTMYSGEVVSFKSENKSHAFVLLKIKNSSVDIQLSSAPIKATLNVGEEQKFDINNDSRYDIAVKLNSITGIIKADITLRSISETVPGTPAAEQEAAAQEAAEQEAAAAGEAKSNKALWIVIIVIVIVIAVIAYIFMNKKKR